MKHTIVGVDIAKNVMQMHWVDPDTGEVVNKPIKRAVFLEHFANRSPCLIGMEACGGAQHWARRLIEMGHEVKLMPAKFVKAFNSGNKNDAADARAIWMATQMNSKAVAVKTEAQQAVLALHRMRQQLVKFRTMQINSLRGLLTEYGEVIVHREPNEPTKQQVVLNPSTAAPSERYRALATASRASRAAMRRMNRRPTPIHGSIVRAKRQASYATWATR
jgi:transposase